MIGVGVKRVGGLVAPVARVGGSGINDGSVDVQRVRGGVEAVTVVKGVVVTCGSVTVTIDEAVLIVAGLAD